MVGVLRVKASVCQADVQRFEPHLGHNWLSCSVFLVKSRHFGLPLAQAIRPNWQSLLAVARSIYIRGVFRKSVPEETRTIYCSKSERVITRLYLCRWHHISAMKVSDRLHRAAYVSLKT